VRIALGASHQRVMGLMVVQGMKPVAVGIGVGPSPLWLSRFIASLLFGVTAGDPVTYGGVTLLLVATGMLACVLPVRKALRVDVASALRTE
jgi:ABC-type antimicrobial peptide transport system permease subunit